jgi:hypothetical protein
MSRILPMALAAACFTLPGLALGGAAHRTAGSTGVGLRGTFLGSNIYGAGISAKHFLTDDHAIQGVVGLGGNTLLLNADYLFEQKVFGETEGVEFAWNIGPGAGLGIASDASALGLSVSGVAGLEIALVPIPLDFVLEYRPELVVIPVIALDIAQFYAHVRWFF